MQIEYTLLFIDPITLYTLINAPLVLYCLIKRPIDNLPAISNDSSYSLQEVNCCDLPLW